MGYEPTRGDLDAQVQLTLRWWLGVLDNQTVIQAFMYVLVTCKDEEVPAKNEGARVVTKDFHCKYMQIFYDAQVQ